MVKKISSLILILCLVVTASISQTLSNPIDVQLNLNTTTDQIIPDAILDTLTDPFNLLVSEPQLNVGVSFKLPDNISITKINVTLGTTLAASDLINVSFIYGNTNPGGSLSYDEADNFIKLGLGNHVNSNNALYYSSIELEDVNGNKSAIISTNSSQ